MNNEDNAKFWEDIYLADDTGWDLNGPTPIFEHIAESVSYTHLTLPTKA